MDPERGRDLERHADGCAELRPFIRCPDASTYLPLSATAVDWRGALGVVSASSVHSDIKGLFK
jgi:hypothetical protein